MRQSCATPHRVIPPPRFISNHDQSNVRRSQPAHHPCQSGAFLQSDKPYNMIMASERLVVGDVTPTLLDLLQGSVLQVEKDINASSPKPTVPLTANPTSTKHQTADESILPDLDCTEAAVASTEGNPITCPIKSNPKGAAKRVPSPKGLVHQLADFPCSDQKDRMESHENYQVQPPRREPSTTTASSVRSRSYIMADKLSSILRPSASTNFLGEASSRPLPLRRLKTSFGVGDDMDSDEDEDQAALSRVFRKQYTQWSPLEQQQLPGAARDRMTGGLEGRDNPSVGFRPIGPRPHSSLFSLRSLERSRLVSMKSFQGPICRPDSCHSFKLPSPHDHATLKNIPNSPAFNFSGTIADAERDQALSINGASSCSSSSQAPENVFFVNHSKRNSAGGVTSAASTLGAQFCSSPLSLRSPSHYSPQLPPPSAAAAYSSSHEEAAYRKDPRRLRHHPEPYHKKHRHSSSAPMKILREASMDLEPLKEVKLSITNPDIEFTEPDHASLQKLNPVPTQSSSSSASACVPQDKEIHLSSQFPSGESFDATSAADEQDGGQDPNDGEVEDPDRSGHAESTTTQATEKVSQLTQVMKADEGEINASDSPKPSSRRRSWLSSSLSLRILPQRSASLKSAALNISPARLRKSLSIGGRISSADLSSPPLVHLESASPTRHHHHDDGDCSEPAGRPHPLAQENSTVRGTSRQEVNKGTGSSLATLLGLFTRPKRSPSMMAGEAEEKRGRSGSPASELVSSSSSTWTGEGGGPSSFFESGRAHGAPSVASPATSLFCPYLSNPPDDILDLAHALPAPYPHSQVVWTSRLNSVGSFLDDSLPISAYSALVIANPDSSRYSEAGDTAC